jgi:hypothetical protein
MYGHSSGIVGMRISLRRLLPIFVRLALILLIQCPLPVLHAHGATAAELSNIPSLPAHLRVYHRANERPGTAVETFGWHVHFLPPLGTPNDQRNDGQDLPEVDLPWSSTSESEAEPTHLVRVDFVPATVPAVRLFVEAQVVDVESRYGDAFGDIGRRQRQAILRA